MSKPEKMFENVSKFDLKNLGKSKNIMKNLKSKVKKKSSTI